MIAVRAFAAVCALTFGGIALVAPALAQGEGDVWTQAAAPDGSATISMPCADPLVMNASTHGIDGLLCQFEGSAYLMVLSEGEGAAPGTPFSSNFDSAAQDIRTSIETDMFQESQIDGRRVIVAKTGREPRYGMMKAIEMAPAKVVYAVVMETERRSPDEDDHDIARADRFIDSLKVVDR